MTLEDCWDAISRVRLKTSPTTLPTALIRDNYSWNSVLVVGSQKRHIGTQDRCLNPATDFHPESLDCQSQSYPTLLYSI